MEYVIRQWYPDNQDFKEMLNDYSLKKEYTSKFLDASEAFAAAVEIGEKYPGIAILLYVAAVNVFAPGPDIVLREQIRSAKKLFIEKDIWGNEDVKATCKAAHEKANFIRISKFLEEEFTEALKQIPSVQGMSPEDLAKKEDEARKISEQIISFSHLTRHEAKIDKKNSKIVIMDQGGDMHILTKLDNEGKGRVSDKPISGIFQLKISEFKKVLEPAKKGCAYTIAKNIKIWYQK